MLLEVTSLSAREGEVHFVSTTAVNWVILQDDAGVTLIDGGYPGHADAVLESLRRIGSAPEEIRAALLTHAHVDHLGGLVKLRGEYAFDVYADPREVAHARREYLMQANAASLAPIAWQPRVLRWLSQIIPLGALSRTGLDDAAPFPELAALPGRPIAVPSPGHTPGHSAFLVADGEALVSGDALISGHPITSHQGPQCLGPIFTHDPEENAESLAALAATEAHLLLPGHGGLWEGTMRAAVGEALSTLRH
ncbi:MAG: MBL fold metallo-hydrolase [Gordonia sp. (in: high G+C Gram-positive bacteria)]|uniref:MBL fold metallo-hydrolase n=1 Tax=Gordonia sp. (in: high G+C Gram-positive bacteria) TaxID=84139 RepID=UPI0039E62F0D